jgi:hypothetical protein
MTKTTETTTTKRETMRAILLDPKTASAVAMILPRGEGFLAACYAAIGCDTIDIVAPESGGVELIIDDEGLLNDPEFFTVFDGMILAGSVIVTGPADDEGNLTDCTLSGRDLSGRVEFARKRVAA